MLRAMLIATVLSLGMLGQPKEAICYNNCWTRCFGQGAACGNQCICGCRPDGSPCVCFAIYNIPQALTDGYSFE